MALPLKTTNLVSVTNHCIVYGKAKSGKTRLLATAPNVVICSADNGLSSIREQNLPFHEVNRYSDYLQFEHAATSGEFTGKTVAIDDLTELASIFLTEEKPKHKNKMQAFGALYDEMSRVIRFWRCKPELTCVMICKQERIKDESTGGLIYAPCLPGKAVSLDLPYLVGAIYHMEEWIDPTTQVRHEVLRCKQNAQFEAGDRSGKLAELEPANLTAIFQKTLS